MTKSYHLALSILGCQSAGDIRSRIRKAFDRAIPTEQWMSKDDKLNLIEESIASIGGWDEIEKQIKIGVANGYSEEQQLALLEALARKL